MNFQNFDPENNDTHAFAKLLVHHYPHNKMVSGDELDWAMQWLRRNSLKDEVNRNNDDWVKDLRTLRLHGYDTHRLDRKRAIKVSAFIWSHEGEEPSFQKLLDWLKSEDAAAEKATSAKIKAAQKKKKLKRKQSKLSRKRRR